MRILNSLATAAGVGCLLLASCDSGLNQTPGPPDVAAKSGTSGLTTREFRTLVGGKTKQEIRTLLGTPKNLSTAPHRREVWHYDTRDLKLYDEDAGMEVKGDATVIFDDSGIAMEGNYNFKSEYIFS